MTRTRSIILLFATLSFLVGAGYFLGQSSGNFPLSIFDTDHKGTSLVNEGGVAVKRVIDGDTFELGDGNRVRLIGINTPESVRPESPVECYGKEASEKLRTLIEGKEIRLEKDISEYDRYGRLLRYAYLGDEMVNETLVAAGYARAATFPPDVKYRDVFRAREREAREEKRGLWADEVCTGRKE